jgi:hypothetical protein
MQSYCHRSSIVKRQLCDSIGRKPDEGGLLRWIIEGFFFDAIVVRASLAAETPHVIQGLVAVPACPLRLQVSHAPGLRGTRLPGWVSTIIYLVCIIHDSAAIKKYWSALASAAVRPACSRSLCSCSAECVARSIVRTAEELKSMAKKSPACFPQADTAEKSPPALRAAGESLNLGRNTGAENNRADDI